MNGWKKDVQKKERKEETREVGGTENGLWRERLIWMKNKNERVLPKEEVK